MAHGKCSTNGCAGEEPPPLLLASKEVIFHTDPDGIITWLKHVGEPRIDAFWMKYFFPPQFCVALPSLASQFTAFTDMVRGQMNYILWSKIHISEGLRFPLPPPIHQFLHYTWIHPAYVHVNIIQVLIRVCVLNKRLNLRLGLEEVLLAYSLKWHKLGWYYLVVDAPPLHLVTNLSNTSKNKP